MDVLLFAVVGRVVERVIERVVERVVGRVFQDVLRFVYQAIVAKPNGGTTRQTLPLSHTFKRYEYARMNTSCVRDSGVHSFFTARAHFLFPSPSNTPDKCFMDFLGSVVDFVPVFYGG